MTQNSEEIDTFVTVELKDRIATIIKVNQHNASSFAEVLGVQRSSMSHILNGRNKPSLDFIEKVLLHFPRVDASWLITGKQVDVISEEESQTVSKPSVKKSKSKTPQLVPKVSLQNKMVDRIVIFYSDGTFGSYEQS